MPEVVILRTIKKTKLIPAVEPSACWHKPRCDRRGRVALEMVETLSLKIGNHIITIRGPKDISNIELSYIRSRKYAVVSNKSGRS